MLFAGPNMTFFYKYLFIKRPSKEHQSILAFFLDKTSNLASSKAHQLLFVLQCSRMLFQNTFTGVLQSSAACWMQARRLTLVSSSVAIQTEDP